MPRQWIPEVEFGEVVAVVTLVSGQKPISQLLRMSGDHEVWHHSPAFSASLKEGSVHLPGQNGYRLSCGQKSKIPVCEELNAFTRRQNWDNFCERCF